jgi:cytochrome c oxidase assembly protein subunit 15
MRPNLLPIGLMIFIQFALGVATLVMKVPINLASMHQMGACILVLLTTRAFFYQENRLK